jgi:hypothetical protein
MVRPPSPNLPLKPPSSPGWRPPAGRLRMAPTSRMGRPPPSGRTTVRCCRINACASLFAHFFISGKLRVKDAETFLKERGL